MKTVIQKHVFVIRKCLYLFSSFTAVFGVKQYSRGRKLYNVNVDLKSSLMDLKMKSKFDNRNMKTLGTDIDLTYVIRKVARDNIKFVSKVINLSSKALTKLRTQK